MGTTHGMLARFHAGRITIDPVRLPLNDILTMMFDRDGNLWLGLQNRGLARLHNGELSLVSFGNGLPGEIVESLFEDAEHNVWAGLFDGGLVQFRDGAFSVYGPPEGLSDNLICCAVEAQDRSIWAAAGATGELNHILPDNRVQVYTRRDGLAPEGIHSLLLGRDGTLWIGHRHGVLSRFRNGRFTVFRDPLAKGASVNGLLEDHTGTLWIGTYGAGVARLQNGQFEHVTTKGDIPSLAEAPDGAIWIATDGDGVFRLQHGAWTHYTNADGLKDQHAQSLWIDSDGTVWVGLTTGGLASIRNGHITSYTQTDGLFDSTAADLVEDHLGNLWMGSDHGIFTVSRHDLDAFASGRIGRVHSVAYDTSDGMRSRETMQGGVGAGTAGPDGRLLFPTLNGLAVVDPALVRNMPPVQVRIESVVYGGQAVPMTGSIAFGPVTGRLTIHFTGLTFIAPTRTRFRYKLDGFDRDWVEAGESRVAEFTSLPPGRYTFRLQAARYNGSWGEQSEAFSFVVRTPWYNTWTAWLAYFGFASLVTWTIVAWRTRRLLRGRDELERMVADRTSQLEQEKTALAEARERLQIQATHDSLTGLWNRGAILDHMRRELNRAQRGDHALTVILAALDHFKQVNDGHGHICGDHVLFESARRLEVCLRAYDFIGRYGGEEFLILMPGCDPAISLTRIEHLVASISGSPMQVEHGEMHMTCSFGVTVFRPDGNTPSVEELIACADAALYAAKNGGRNRAQFKEFALKEALLTVS
jgi:diguanylate cyclase (GGDEF)-like protein